MGFVDYPEIRFFPGAMAYVGTWTLEGWKENFFNISQYATEKAAVEAAAAWVSATYGGGIVHLENRTWNAAIVIDEDDIILEGEGWNTIIDETADSAHAITVTGARVVIRDLQVATSAAGGNAYDGINSTGDYLRIQNVFVNGSDQYGIYAAGINTVITGCRIFDPDVHGLYCGGLIIISDCYIQQTGQFGIYFSAFGDGSIVEGNHIVTTADDGINIHVDAENCIIVGNTILSWTNEPIDDNSGTSLVANNNAGGTVLTSKGCSMATIALAVTYVGASGWIEVPSGTWNERITVSNNDVLLKGQGWDTIINETVDSGHAITVTGARVLIRDLQCITAPGGANVYDGINSTGDYLRIQNVFVNGSDNNGIITTGINTVITDCYVFDPDLTGILAGGSATIIRGCDINQVGQWGIILNADADNSVVTGNYVNDTGEDGIAIYGGGNNCTVVGNSILNWTNEPIDDDSGTSLVANNNAGGAVLTSKGCSMATIALAVTYVGASGWIEVPSGTWNERVTLGNADVLLRGQGWDTIINETVDSGHAITVTGARCVIRDLQCGTAAGGANAYNAINTSGDYLRIKNVFINGSDSQGIDASGLNTLITDCYVFDADEVGIMLRSASIVSDNYIFQSGTHAIQLTATGDDSNVTGNYILTSGDDGILITGDAENCVVTGNRISGWTNEPIDDDSGTSLVANNNAGGSVLTSKGCSMATIALAVTYVGASGWIEVPSGTWDERVTLGSADVTLRGQGWDTIINETADSGPAIAMNGARCIVRDLQVVTTPAGGNAYDAIQANGTNCSIIDVYVSGSDQYGISISTNDAHVRGCWVVNADDMGIICNGPDCIISDNKIQGSGTYGIGIVASGDATIVHGNVIDTTGNDGILIEAAAENCTVVGNSIQGWTNEPIDDDSGTSLVANNWAGGTVLTSKGCSMATIALALTYVGASGWVEVPSGTWNERITVSNNDVLLKGQGWDTIIDETVDSGHAITITGARVIVRDLQTATSPGGANAYNGISSSGTALRVQNVFVNGSDQHGMAYSGADTIITDCYIFDADEHGINPSSATIIRGCDISQSGSYGIKLEATADNSIITGTYIVTTGLDGILIGAAAENCTVVGNNITGWTGEPIDDDSATSTVYNNNCGGPVLTSKGCSMATIALAVTYVGASGWIEVPSGTWDERVTLANNDVILRGQGWDTIIDETADSGHAITVTGDRCVIRDLQVATTPGGTNAYDGINATGNADFLRIQNVFVNGSDQHGIYCTGGDTVVTECYLYDADDDGIQFGGVTFITLNYILQSGSDGAHGTGTGDNSILKGNYIATTGDDGIYLAAGCDNCTVKDNRLTGWTNEALDDDATGTKLRTIKSDFVQGTVFISADGLAKGWEINAEADMAVAFGNLDPDVQAVVRIDIRGVALGAPVGAGGQMHLDVLFNAGAAGGEDYDVAANSWTLANFDSEEADYVADKILHWIIEDGDVGNEIRNLAGGDDYECKINGGTAADPDGATNATFRTMVLHVV